MTRDRSFLNGDKYHCVKDGGDILKIKSSDFPGETLRILLKEKEIEQFGEYHPCGFGLSDKEWIVLRTF